MLGIGASRDLPAVLIIDDDLISREVMATVLTMTGYTIYTATQGEDAIAQLDAGTCNPEVILMDAQMPGLNGAGLVEQLRARSKAIIYSMSASDVSNHLRKVVDGHLAKPFAPQALQQLLNQHHSPAAVKPEEDLPVVKAETLTQLRGMMSPAAVREIYMAVVQDLDIRATALQQAMDSGDGQEIRRLGHAIKGGASMAGAMQASRVGAKLEAGGDQLDNVPAMLEELKAARGNLRRMLEAEFPAQG